MPVGTGWSLMRGVDLQAGRLRPEHHADRLLRRPPRPWLAPGDSGRIISARRRFASASSLTRESSGSPASRMVRSAPSGRGSCGSVARSPGSRDAAWCHLIGIEGSELSRASRFRSSRRPAGGPPGRRGGRSSARRCARPRVPPSRRRGASARDSSRRIRFKIRIEAAA